MSPTLSSPNTGKENAKLVTTVYEQLMPNKLADLAEYGQSSLGMSKRNSATNSDGRLEPRSMNADLCGDEEQDESGRQADMEPESTNMSIDFIPSNRHESLINSKS